MAIRVNKHYREDMADEPIYTRDEGYLASTHSIEFVLGGKHGRNEMVMPYLVIDRSGNAVDINRRIDTMYNDPWNQKKAEVLELYLQGKSPAIISDLTGVPRIRIERELNRLTERRPELLSAHLAAQYPSRRKLLTDVDPAVLLGAV